MTGRTPALLVAHAAFQHALFPIPIITLFWKDEIGMSFTAIMVLQAIFSATIVLFEFPSGYVADRVGYRASLLIGGRPVGAHRLPQLAPVQRQTDLPHPVGPKPEQLVARHAPADVVAGRGDVAVQGQVHAVDQFPHRAMPSVSRSRKFRPVQRTN